MRWFRPGAAFQSSETYSVGALPGMGVDTVVGPGAAASAPVQVVAFENLAPITTSIPASSLSIAPATTVFGLTGSLLNGSNAITVGQGPSPGFGVVQIDNAEPIAFANKTGLAINSGPGTDTISVDSTSAPTGLTQVTVTGGDPGAGDTLIYNAPLGSTSAITVLPGAQGSGEVTVAPDPSPQNVHFNNIGNLKIAALAALGDVLDIEGTAGNDTYFFTPGSSSDSGTVTGTLDANNATGLGPFALPVLTFSGIPPSTSSTFSGVNFGELNAGGDGTATLVYNGPAGGATLAVSPPQSIPSGMQIAATVGGQLYSVVNGFALANLVVNPGPGGGAVTVTGGVNVPVEVQGNGLASNTTHLQRGWRRHGRSGPGRRHGRGSRAPTGGLHGDHDAGRQCRRRGGGRVRNDRSRRPDLHTDRRGGGHGNGRRLGPDRPFRERRQGVCPRPPRRRRHDQRRRHRRQRHDYRGQRRRVRRGSPRSASVHCFR